MIESVAKSIVFVLDTQLKVKELNLSNLTSNLIVRIDPDDRRLKLSDLFEDLWKTYWQSNFIKASEFYLLVGPKAGFTDGRIVHNWLKTMVMFYPDKEYFVSTIKDSDDEFLEINWRVILTKSKADNNQELVYSRRPRIGSSG
jgi:hypothetical protein